MQSFRTIGQPLLGEKFVTRKKERRKIIPKIVDTSFRCIAQGQRTHFARTNKYGCAMRKYFLHQFVYIVTLTICLHCNNLVSTLTVFSILVLVLEQQVKFKLKLSVALLHTMLSKLERLRSHHLLIW